MNTALRVVKIGGNVIDNEVHLTTILDACAAFNAPFVLVHGGGNIATEVAQQLGAPQTMIDGRRITDASTLRVLTMVFAGLVNKNIVTALQARGINAIGLTGADGNLTRAVRRGVNTTDFGFVGDITWVNTPMFTSLLQSGMCPVCAPLSHDGNGSLLNTNADDVARVLAVALTSVAVANRCDAVELTYIFDHAGVLRNVNDPSSAIPTLTRDEAKALVADGTITKGMLPKLENAFVAAENGVRTVRITRYDNLDGGTLIYA